MLKRLDEFTSAYQQLDADKMMNYIYPKLFAILSRERVRANLDSTLSFIKGKDWYLDSIVVRHTYPSFTIEQATYVRIIFAAVIEIKVDKPEGSIRENVSRDSGIVHEIRRYPAPQSTLMAALLRRDPNIEKIQLDSATGHLHLSKKGELIGIKDKYATEWSFIARDSSINLVFDKKVIDKLASYN